MTTTTMASESSAGIPKARTLPHHPSEGWSPSLFHYHCDTKNLDSGMRRNDGRATLKFPSKSAMLERSEQRGQFRQRRTVRRLQPLHRLNSTGEFLLESKGRNVNLKILNVLLIVVQFISKRNALIHSEKIAIYLLVTPSLLHCGTAFVSGFISMLFPIFSLNEMSSRQTHGCSVVTRIVTPAKAGVQATKFHDTISGFRRSPE